MARPPRLLAGALLATAVLQCTSPSNTSHCANGWSRHSDESWAVVEAPQPDADGDFGRDTGPVIYLGTYVSTGECAAACRAYTHMDTTCEGFTHYHLSHLTRPLQCLGAVSGTLSVNGKLESSRAMSGILFSLPRVRGPELVVNHPWQGDVITSQELLYLEWLWTSLEDGAVTIVFSGALDVRVENVATEITLAIGLRSTTSATVITLSLLLASLEERLPAAGEGSMAGASAEPFRFECFWGWAACENKFSFTHACWCRRLQPHQVRVQTRLCLTSLAPNSLGARMRWVE